MTVIKNDRIYGIIGSGIGDITGSRFEFEKGFPKKSFKLFGADSSMTDDSVLTIAVADAILNNRTYPDVVVVYGCSADDTDGEKGFSNTHPNGFSHLPLQKGFPIHVIGTLMEVVKKDVKDLIAKVKNEPETTFIIENVGLSKKTNIGAKTMAPIFAPLKDKENVYFVKDYWDYYKKWI